MSERIQSLAFASLFTYCPRGSTAESDKAKNVMWWIKHDYVLKGGIATSEWIAKKIKEELHQLQFKGFFGTQTILVPVPKSSLIKNDALWVPDRIAMSLERYGLGKVGHALKRTKSVPKSSTSPSSQRPLPSEHYDSMTVHGTLTSPEQIILIDDIITRGHTVLGAAWRLHDVYPTSKIAAFAAMRTVSDPSQFSSLYEPIMGTVAFRPESGDALRRP